MTSRDELARVIDDVVKRYVGPAAYDQIADRVFDRIASECIEAARRDVAMTARSETRAEVARLVGNVFAVKIEDLGPVQGSAPSSRSGWVNP